MNINSKALVFTCNWGGYSGLEAAGRQQHSYPPEVYPIRVMCLGRVSPGVILRAFELGATGVLLLGCLPEECHYEFGNRRAEEIFGIARDLVRLLGYPLRCLQMDAVAIGDGGTWAEKVRDFMDGLDG
jgi:F420-non-reducing hydrogenase iron-sulfur subunit